MTNAVPLKVQTIDVWHRAFQQVFVLVTAMNIGTTGFFWWYLPEFVSSFFDKIRDLEHNADLEVKRTPELRLSWGHLVLEASDLNSVGIILPWIARSNQERIEAFQRYFRALALMAKNDIFFQFEPNIVTEFIGAFRDAMRSNGDWDGKPETLDAVMLSSNRRALIFCKLPGSRSNARMRSRRTRDLLAQLLGRCGKSEDHLRCLYQTEG